PRSIPRFEPLPLSPAGMHSLSPTGTSFPYAARPCVPMSARSVEIARFGHHPRIARMTMQSLRHTSLAPLGHGQPIEQIRAIINCAGHNMYPPLLALWPLPFDHCQARSHAFPAILLEPARPHQPVGNAGFVVDRQENGIAL